MHVCLGPTPGAILTASLRRPAAALTLLAVLAATLTAPPVDQPAATASCTPCTPAALPDVEAETRALLAAERTSRAQRHQPEAAQGVGQAAQPAVKTVKAQPKQPRKPAAKPPRRTQSAPAAPARASGSLAVVVAYALAQRGKPYRWASAGPGSFDCSGLIKASFARIGINLPHQSGSIAARGRTVPRSQLRAGDTLHWPGHVALAIGGNLMVHASRPGVPVKVATIYGNPQVVRIVG